MAPEDIETKSGELKHQREDYGRPYVAIENFIEVFVPFDGDGAAFLIQPSSYSLWGLRCQVDQRELRFKISLTTTAPPGVVMRVTAALRTSMHRDTIAPLDVGRVLWRNELHR